jgi:hypothetical protein
LATNELVPLDLAEGRVLWVKIMTLFTVSGIIPLLIPRQYIPVDPKVSQLSSSTGTSLKCFQNPMPVANAEQTSSLFSLVLYFFLDPIIFLGYRVPHLKFDQLPPLCDYDYAENLRARAWPVWLTTLICAPGADEC